MITVNKGSRAGHRGVDSSRTHQEGYVVSEVFRVDATNHPLSKKRSLTTKPKGSVKDLAPVSGKSGVKEDTENGVAATGRAPRAKRQKGISGGRKEDISEGKRE